MVCLWHLGSGNVLWNCNPKNNGLRRPWSLPQVALRWDSQLPPVPWGNCMSWAKNCLCPTPRKGGYARAHFLHDICPCGLPPTNSLEGGYFCRTFGPCWTLGMGAVVSPSHQKDTFGGGVAAAVHVVVRTCTPPLQGRSWALEVVALSFTQATCLGPIATCHLQSPVGRVVSADTARAWPMPRWPTVVHPVLGESLGVPWSALAGRSMTPLPMPNLDILAGGCWAGLLDAQNSCQSMANSCVHTSAKFFLFFVSFVLFLG